MWYTKVERANLSLMAYVVRMLHHLIVSVLSLLLSSDAFAPSPSSSFLLRVASSSSLKVNGSGNGNNFNNDIVVISPPGGVGEMTATESAKLGGNVKWFIVAPPSAASISTKTAGSVSISAETMSYIHNSGGSIDFASACTTDLLQSSEGSNNSNEALNAMRSWCNNPSCIIATYDGINIAIAKSLSSTSSGSVGDSAGEGRVMGEMIESMRSGIRLAAREVSRNCRSNSRSIAILATGEEQEIAEEAGAGGGVSGMVGNLESMIANLVGKSTNSNDMPCTLKQAISTSSSTSSGTTTTTVIRYGELFGAPESSSDSSPFMGGPRRDPVVRDMYAMRSVRIDPSFTGGGGSGEGGMGYRSNRLTLAEATARLGLGRIISTTTTLNPAKMMEISVSSFPGTDGPSIEEWENEFRRVISEINKSSTSQSTSVVTLFRAEFASVPSSKRLAAWLAEKWAPAVLRSYDIAGIRVGSRPVYANVIPDSSTDDDGSVTVVEIVWQDLVNFNPVTSGRMYITVSPTGISATRGPGSVSSGFGAVALVPLAGEEILVKRLADAASQAVEKGLAVKAISTKKTEVVVVEAVAAPSVTTIFTPPDDTVVPSMSSDKSGPRNTGARRSSERTRGSKTTSSSVNYDGE